MKRNIILVTCLSLLSNIAFAAYCGKVTNILRSKDSGKLIGITVKRSFKRGSKKLRVTSDESPLFMETLFDEIREIDYMEPLDFFVCLDKYKIYKRRYSRLSRVYAQVESYRIYRGGDLLVSFKKE